MKEIDLLEDALREVLKGLDDAEQRRTVLSELAKYNVFLESVQRLPLRLRLKYWQGSYVIFDYLRRNGQLGRTVGKFDKNVKKIISCALRKLLNETNEN